MKNTQLNTKGKVPLKTSLLSNEDLSDNNYREGKRGMKKKVLIISYYFAPENKMGAIRFTKISKYLVREGYDVEVICYSNITKKDTIGEEDIKQIDKIHKINDSPIYNLLKKRRGKMLQEIKTRGDLVEVNHHRIKKCITTILKTIDKFFFTIIYDISFANQAKKYIKKNYHLFKDINVVITTYNYASSHMLGVWLKRNLKNIKWIADFRDPMVNNQTPHLLRPYFYMLERKFCKRADAVISVANGCISESAQQIIAHKHYVITNGYDSEDSYTVNHLSNRNFKLTFCYTGAMYAGKRDLSIFFQALKELISSHQCIQKDILIKYAGTEYDQIVKQAKKYELLDNIEYCGYVSRNISIELQYNADILLMATWNNKKNTDILTGKFFEYMMANKPIIAIVNGTIKYSKLNQMIQDMNLGFCYESCNHIEDYYALKEYISWQYDNYKKSGQVEFNVDKEKVGDYSYEKITQKFIEIFEKK
jgi:glycosyltransferase involved in cell wall biosynthesis